MSATKVTSHILGAVHFWIGVYYDWHYVKIPNNVIDMGDDFAGKLKFLTYWDVILQAVFFTICVINDVIGTNEDVPKKTPLIRKIKDLLLPCLAFPLAMFVSITFWGLYLVDRELVFPKALDPYFPGWLNHNMHTNIAVFILLEMFSSFRTYPKRKTGLTVLLAFMATYLVWIHIIHAKSGKWVYPILNLLTLPGRVLFFLVLFILAVGLYILGEKLNNLIWKQKIKVK